MATKMSYEFNEETKQGVLNVLEGPAKGQYKFDWANAVENGHLIIGAVSLKIAGGIKHVRLTAPLASLPGLEEKLTVARTAARTAAAAEYSSPARQAERQLEQKMEKAGFRG